MKHLKYERVLSLSLRPTEIIRCFFVLDIGMDAYLTDKDPTDSMSDPAEVDHLYREIVKGVYYPVESESYIEGKKIVGYFYDEENKEYLCFYNEEFYTDAEWRPVSKEFLNIISLLDKK